MLIPDCGDPSVAVVVTETKANDEIHAELNRMSFEKSHQGDIERLSDENYIVIDYFKKVLDGKELVLGLRSPVNPVSEVPVTVVKEM